MLSARVVSGEGRWVLGVFRRCCLGKCRSAGHCEDIWLVWGHLGKLVCLVTLGENGRLGKAAIPIFAVGDHHVVVSAAVGSWIDCLS